MDTPDTISDEDLRYGLREESYCCIIIAATTDENGDTGYHDNLFHADSVDLYVNLKPDASDWLVDFPVTDGNHLEQLEQAKLRANEIVNALGDSWTILFDFDDNEDQDLYSIA